MNIAIIDADLIGRPKHRFPNLACMKLSGYHKALGDEVFLKTTYNGLDTFDKVYISKVFTDTMVPDDVLDLSNVSYGGTGFYYASAPKLPDEVEHYMPDYHLYDEWVQQKIRNGGKPRYFEKVTKNIPTSQLNEFASVISNSYSIKPSDYQYYTDYSIGFLTRGCFRQCKFCVNQNYKKVERHSPLSEFVDESRPKICLLDDNFFGSPDWKEMLTELRNTGKPFIFKQGLDERLLTDEKCELLFTSKYAGDFAFAFDNIADYDLVQDKLELIRQHTEKVCKFFCFCGFDRNDKWDGEFWAQDIFDLLARIELLMNYRCLPYIMRFNRYVESPYARLYTSIARWCNQPQFFKKKSLREFAIANGENSACYKAVYDFEKQYPKVGPYLDMKFITHYAFKLVPSP